MREPRASLSYKLKSHKLTLLDLHPIRLNMTFNFSAREIYNTSVSPRFPISQSCQPSSLDCDHGIGALMRLQRARDKITRCSVTHIACKRDEPETEYRKRLQRDLHGCRELRRSRFRPLLRHKLSLETFSTRNSTLAAGPENCALS